MSVNGLLAPDAQISAAVDALIAGAPPGARIPCPGPIHVALRRERRLVASFWREDGELTGTLAKALLLARQAGANLLQLDLCHGFGEVEPQTFAHAFANAHRGVRGLEIAFGGEVLRHAPSMAIATNRSFSRALELFLERRGLSRAAFLAGGGRFRRFDARQVLVALGPPARAVTLFRGGRLVPLDRLHAAGIAEMARTMGEWLRRQVGADGRMAYKLWPSRSERASTDNPIRQFMASLALIRLARRSGAGANLQLAERNLRHNLERFYRQAGPVGVVVHDGSAKLGAAALAALAILEAPFRERFAEPLARLDAGVRSLWQPDGSFRTFHFPAERNDNQNFYPGEALLYWATRHAETADPELLMRCMKSFAYYREWHRKDRNPAFIPWHTQAYALLHARTGEPALRAFVFEMNDWLLPLQQWESAPYPDLAGRFYDPARPALGPPHASSTGVYLEGLAAALRLADACEDLARRDAYRRALWRGLRSLRQLQFKDDLEAFYVGRPERVLGGVRTEAYDNAIRIDNVQHGLMALLKLLDDAGFLASTPG